MKDNYKQGGADYTGKTVSQCYTITLVSDSVKIEANKDSVVRSKSFSVTVTGRPSTFYYLWVKGTGSMLGGYDDQPPLIVLNQEGVFLDAQPTASALHRQHSRQSAVCTSTRTVADTPSLKITSRYTGNGSRATLRSRPQPPVPGPLSSRPPTGPRHRSTPSVSRTSSRQASRHLQERRG